ncbi:hypothetical protein NGRA_1648 [Nosema granulosis]|uniref:Uncharacterized protein n=1 Tax=Nosema granulosis TaxID=83296 RepID=A0A9P6KYW8_9MICR|nr:hypothetical protein NGRA_1648 [Nosema granulosis]
MHELKKKENEVKFIQEILISNKQDVSTFIATKEKTNEKVILKKTLIPINSTLQTIMMNKEINNSRHILKTSNMFEKDKFTVVVQEYEGFMPLDTFLRNENNFICVNEQIILYVVLKIFEILAENSLTKMIRLVDVENIWLNEEGDLKICWMSTILRNLRLFDNEVYKMNINSLENINKLMDLNSKHCKKRIYNFPNKSDDRIEYATKTTLPNMFVYEKSVIFQDAGKTINKTGKRKYGNKKICIERSEYEKVSEIEQRKKVINGDFIKKLVSKMIFYRSAISEKDLEANITRLTQIFKEERPTTAIIDHVLTASTLQILRSLFEEQIIPEEMLKKLRDALDLQAIKKEIRNVLNRDKEESPSIKEVFARNGFNMEGYNTISYKKGRFQVYEAVPAPTENKKEHIEDLLRIVDIQNRQIEMIYRTMKERNSIDKLEDDQLESLQKEISNILQKITKDEN